MRVIVTGAAGFIGYHLAERLCAHGDEVHGFDNLNDYYDVRLKQARLARLMERETFRWTRGDLADRAEVDRLFDRAQPDVVVNLAAQVGVRNSVTKPHDYVETNVVGFLNVLEACRRTKPAHLVFASSSSVYGANASVPFSEHDPVEHPLNVYAATKKTNELLAHSYAHLYGVACTGLRFFTVYGPWGRPDMALFSFSDAILSGRTIELYGEGKMLRDFTYVDDVVEGIARVVDAPAKPSPAWDAKRPDPATSAAPYRVYNIGPSEPVPVTRFVEVLEKALGVGAKKELKPMHPADVPVTSANVGDLVRDFGYRPKVTIDEGIPRFVEWYRAWRNGELFAPAQATGRR